MILGLPTSIVYTFEVFEPGDPPQVGDVFEDPRKHMWHVRGVGPVAPALRSPEPDYDGVRVTLEADHQAYRVEPGEVFRPWTGTRRSGQGWSGLLTDRGAYIEGFGAINFMGDLASFSWYYRHTNGRWFLKIGDAVRTRNEFDDIDTVAEGEGTEVFDSSVTWVRIAEALGRRRGSGSLEMRNTRPHGT